MLTGQRRAEVAWRGVRLSQVATNGSIERLLVNNNNNASNTPRVAVVKLMFELGFLCTERRYCELKLDVRRIIQCTRTVSSHGALVTLKLFKHGKIIK